MDRLVVERPRVRRAARRGLVAVLRFVADRLRDEVPVPEGPSSAPAVAPPAAAPPPEAPPTATPEVPEVREGAARWVDEHQRDEADATDVPDSALLGALSGDFGPALEERAREAREEDTPVRSGGVPDDDRELIHDRVISTLHSIFDPEIPVDIYDLGLVYGVEVREDRTVQVTMTLTSPNCPAAQSLPGEVETKVARIPAVTGAEVEVVFEPPWTPDLMSEEARLQLNIQ